MKITKSKQEKPIYEGKARITKHNNGVLLSQNRSTSADKRISAVSVYLTQKELLEAVRGVISNKWILKLFDLVMRFER